MKNINNPSTSSIKNWAKDEQPSTKLINQGPENLSHAELIAVLIRTGTKNYSAVELSRQLLQSCHNNLTELARMDYKTLQRIKGIGEAKSLILVAAMELSRRKTQAGYVEMMKINSSKDIADYLKSRFQDLAYEVFAIVLLNRSNKMVHFEIISKGGISGTIADPRIILKKAIDHAATGIIICHNHPSGNLQPSAADFSVTGKIKQAASMIDIQLVDHLIVSTEGYYSFADNNKI